MMMPRDGRKHVVIVGAGFAGLHCAKKLAADTRLRITLIDKNNYQQFQPLLYQVAAGSLSPENAAFNLRDVLLDHENVVVRMSKIVSGDLASKTVKGENGDIYEADFLVLAVGAEANFFHVRGADRYAYPLYNLQDAEHLRSRLLALFEAADRQRNPAGNSSLHLAVIGAGPTGVEIAGAIADILQRSPKNFLPNTDLREMTITLIDMEPKVLAPFTEISQNYATEILTARGVQLRLGASVKEITKSGLLFADGSTLHTDLVIWAGGLKAADLASTLGVARGHGGRIDVQPDLCVPGYPNVYALGDFANVVDENGKALPQLGSVAQQAGRHCAANILAAVAGEEQKPFLYFDKGIMAMVGRNAAVAGGGSKHVSLPGVLVFAAWLGVHALLLTTARAKMEVLFEWAWDYFGETRVAPILDQPDQERQFPDRLPQETRP